MSQFSESAEADPIFGALLGRPAFRSDLLYFTRLAGNYIASIFVDVRNRAPLKHRRAFDDWLAVQAKIDRPLRDALCQRHRPFDPFKRDFAIVLGDMPPYLKERLGRALQYDHALPLDTRSLIACLDDLREYRHWLEHYEERQAKGERQPVIDKRLLHILGLLLLPHLGNHLLGRMRHHGRRIGLGGTAVRAADAKAVLDAALASRREASRFINGLKTRVDHDSIRARITAKYDNAPSEAAVHRIAKEDAKKRRDLEDRKSALIDLHRRYFADGHWPRYNYENFLIRFGFIGRARIAAMEALLREGGKEEEEALDFMLHIEPLFMLSMDLALIIHVFLSDLEQLGVPVRDGKKIGKPVNSIRNAVAHGDWVWSVPIRDGEPLDFAAVLKALLGTLDHQTVNDKAQRRNDLLTAIEGALRPCQWARVYAIPQAGDDPNQMRAAYTVKRWTEQKRAQFADKGRWRIDKRKPLRRVAARWMREIAEVRKAEKI